MSSSARPISICLAGLALALLFVGVVSGTLLRHVVQVLPIAVALVLANRLPSAGAAAAIPICVFWTLIVLLIWLFLLGVSRIANGTYTVAEIMATFAMAGFSAMGLARSLGHSRCLALPARLTVIGLFAVFQIAAMAISMMRAIAHR